MKKTAQKRQPVPDAERLYKQACALLNLRSAKAHVRGFPLMLKSASLGHLPAMSWVAMCYEHGVGTKVNRSKAFAAYQAAAFGGDPSSAYNLGSCYAEGVGVQRNHEASVYWFSRAARKKVPEAIFSLAISVFNGYGVEAGRTKAFEYFRRAARLGYGPAQFWTGRMLELGQGVRANRLAAIKWYRMARRSEPEANKALKRLSAS